MKDIKSAFFTKKFSSSCKPVVSYSCQMISANAANKVDAPGAQSVSLGWLDKSLHDSDFVG